MIDATPRASRSWSTAAPWLIAALAVTLLVLLPIAALVPTAAGGSADLWRHLSAHVLPAAAWDTVVLLAGVGLLAATVGTATAWLVAAHDFPGRGILSWALLLPLALPTYIIAYAYLDLLHPIGPVQTALRALLGFDSPRDFRLPDLRSMGGCILLLGFVLYPYVYLTTRAVFLLQSANFFDAARTLGASRRAVFLRVAVPMARPAIAVGVSLALMEALNDIGAAEFLGVRTMTVAVYTTWITRSDLAGAAQIALSMLAVVLAIVWLEAWARRQRRYANDAHGSRPLTRQRLAGLPAVAALCLGSLPVAVGFLVPTAYLVDAAVERVRFAGISSAVRGEAINTVSISLVATVLTLALGIAIAYTARVSRQRLARACRRISSLGYAVPGTVLAIGLLPIVTGVDAAVDAAAAALWGGSTGLLLLGSGAALVYAYVVRFLAIAIGGMEAGFSRISQTVEEAARTLGQTPAQRLRRIHLPLTRPALAASAMLLFVDCMKELPATLLLRPLGFETLSTHVYAEAARGTYEDGALAALSIVVVGLLPVLILSRSSGGDRFAPEAADGRS